MVFSGPHSSVFKSETCPVLTKTSCIPGCCGWCYNDTTATQTVLASLIPPPSFPMPTRKKRLRFLNPLFSPQMRQLHVVNILEVPTFSLSVSVAVLSRPRPQLSALRRKAKYLHQLMLLLASQMWITNTMHLLQLLLQLFSPFEIFAKARINICLLTKS